MLYRGYVTPFDADVTLCHVTPRHCRLHSTFGTTHTVLTPCRHTTEVNIGMSITDVNPHTCT